MGLEDRDYLRDDAYGRRSIGGRISNSSMVRKLIIATVIVFLAQLITEQHIRGVTPNGQLVVVSSSSVTQWLEMDGQKVLKEGQIWRMLTYAFCHSHSSIFHILFNMLALWWFGRELEQIYGSREFLMFYLFAAVFAAGLQMITCYATGVWHPMVGASGSIMGLLMLYAIHVPRRKVLIWGIIPLEMRFLVPMVVIGDIVMTHGFGMPIARSAHIGGLLFGAIYYYRGIRLERIFDGGLIGNFKDKAKVRKAKRSNLKVYFPQDQRPTRPKSSTSLAALDEQVDHILDKINKQGEASLTEREREVLRQASRIARDRKN
jgi:membrane associated rhomboid family serine protease